MLSHKCKSGFGSTKVRISNKFIADLKRIAELDTKMTEFDELGRLMKLRKEREKLIPKVIDKKKKIRAKRKSRQMALKKWIINILMIKYQMDKPYVYFKLLLEKSTN